MSRDRLRAAAERLQDEYGHLLRRDDRPGDAELARRLDEARQPHGRDQLTIDDLVHQEDHA